MPCGLRQKISRMKRHVWRRYRAVKAMGPVRGIEFAYKEEWLRLWAKMLGRSLPECYRLPAPGSDSGLLCRFNSSDRDVFFQIFIQREYDCLSAASDPLFILDCGAYVGYTSVYYLTEYPAARVLAVEPDNENYSILQRNLAPYGDRATVLKAAVWSFTAGMKISRGKYRDGRQWATQVRLCEDGEEPDIQALDIGQLLVQSGTDRIDILKIDIEQAEISVFSQNYEQWLEKVDTILIELHSSEAQMLFMNALGTGRFSTQKSGELTVAQRLSMHS